MREIRLSEELDRYNLRLFHPLLQYRSATYKYRLVVDGKRWEETAALKTGHEDRISAWMWAGAVRNVEDLSLAELSAHFSDLNLVLSGVRDSPFGWSFDSMELRCTKREPRTAKLAIFKVDRNFDLWAEPISVFDLSAAMQRVAMEHPELEFSYWQQDQELQKGFGISTRAPANDSLRSILWLSRLDDFEVYVAATLAPDRLVRQFNFPSPVKIACEQYLIYFVQFLSDLGIEAESELKEAAHGVLFTVKPKDKGQALAQIWKALEAYLQIPALKEFGLASAQSDDVAVSQMRAQVSHLQGQLHIAAAILQAKNASIAAKDTEIALLKNFDLRMFLQPEPEPKSEQSANEPLMPFVEVKPLTVKDAIVIDLPAIIRALKRQFD